MITVAGAINLAQNARGAINALKEGLADITNATGLVLSDASQEELNEALDQLKAELDTLHADVQTKLRGS